MGLAMPIYYDSSDGLVKLDTTSDEKYGSVWTAAERYNNFVDYVHDGDSDEADKMIAKHCPAYDGTTSGSTNTDGYEVDDDTAFGVRGSGFSNSDLTKLNDDLDDENSAILFPFTWGCQYGTQRPEKTCKFPKYKYYSNGNPCYRPSEALGHAQTAAFVSIVIVQWADLVICKTRKLSIYHQGMSNTVMLFGLFSETCLCAFLAYVPPLHTGIKTRDILFFHWCPSMPYSLLIFLYDETRKYLIRKHNREFKGTPNQEGWLEKFTYY